MAQKILGLDIGAHSIKAVVLEGSARAWEVRAFVNAPLETPPAVETEGVVVAPADGGDTAFQTDTEAASTEPVAGAEAPAGDEEVASPRDPRVLAALQVIQAKVSEWKPELVAMSLPGLAAATPLVTLPFTDTRKIEATLGFEVEGLLPFDLDETLYDYQILHQRDGQSELLVGVVQPEEIAGILGEVRSVGIDPRVITLAGLGIQPVLADRAVKSALPADEEIAVLDLGYDRSVLTVVQGAADEKSQPVLVFTRAFAGGAHELEEASGTDDLRSVDLQTLRRPLMALLREIRQSLRAAQSRTRRPITHLALAGNLASLPGLPEWLTQELGLPVEKIALPGDAGQKIPEEEQPGYALAMGLALRAMVRGGAQLNFRSGEFAYKGDLDYLKGKVSRLVAFAAVLIVLLGANYWAQMRTVTSAEEQLDGALCNITQRVLGSCETDFNVALSKLQGGDTQAAHIPTASALEVFSTVVAQMPADAGVQFEEVDVTLERLRIRGLVDSFDGVDEVVAGLKKSRCIGDVKQGRVQRNKEERIEFTLDALYVCGSNADKAAGQEG